MKSFYIEQRIPSLRRNFTVKNQDEKDVYFAKGSFMKIPKHFIIVDAEENLVAQIIKKPFSFLLSTFFVKVNGQEMVTIKKHLSFLKSRYTIDAMGIEVRGNWWDKNFEIVENGEVIGLVDKYWFRLNDGYRLQIIKEEMETFLISLVIAIAYVKAEEATGASFST